MHIEGNGCALASGNSQVGGDAAVVPPCVAVNGLDGQEAPRRHSLPV